MGSKEGFLITFGLKIMRLNAALTAVETRRIMAEYFKGCRTVATMRAKLQEDGGSDEAAKMLASR